jgi:hypothetical protein
VVLPEVLPVPLVELSVPLVLGEAEGELEELDEESVPEGDDEGELDELLEPVDPVEEPLEDPVDPMPVEPVPDELEGLVDVEPGVVVDELLLVDLRSQAARPSAVAIARGIINAFMFAPGLGVQCSKWASRGENSVR